MASNQIKKQGFNTSIRVFPDGKLMQWLYLLAWILVFSMFWAAFANLLPFADSIWRASINTFTLGVLFYSMIWLINRYYERGQFIVFGFIVLSLLIVMTLVRFSINSGFNYNINAYFEKEPLVVFGGVLITNILALLISFLHEIIRLKRTLKTRQVLLQNEEKEAQLQFLRTQMNPHFLFNTLNNIYSLAVVKSDKTAPLVMRLSDLLKYVIYDSQDGQVSLQQEIHLLEEYIELFQLQQELPVDVQLIVEGEIENVDIEPLLLVPIVENCFKHCDFATNSSAFTHIKVDYKSNKMTLLAKNSYNPDQNQKDVVGGVGLPNIKRRMQLKYPDVHQMNITQTDGIFELFLSIELS